MAEYTLRILKDDQLHSKLSESTREYAISHFHVNKIIPQYIELYERILKLDHT